MDKKDVRDAMGNPLDPRDLPEDSLSAELRGNSHDNDALYDDPDAPFDDPDAIAAEERAAGQQRAPRLAEERTDLGDQRPGSDRQRNASVTSISAGNTARQEQSAQSYPTPHADVDDEAGALLPQENAKALRAQWDTVQTGFIDEPRKAVRDADRLVAEAMQQLATTFNDERMDLERQWDRGDDVSTEDLRIALRRYRTFFQRLLSV